MNKFNSGGLPDTACLRNKVYQLHENGAFFWPRIIVVLRVHNCYRNHYTIGIRTYCHESTSRGKRVEIEMLITYFAKSFKAGTGLKLKS